MRLGKRSTRGRTGNGGQLIARVFRRLGLTCAFAVMANAASAADPMAGDTPVPPTTAGPGRIICNASFCELGSGARPKERYRIIVSGLPQGEIRRLQKCTGIAKPCIVSVDGVEQGSAMRIMATGIHWQD